MATGARNDDHPSAVVDYQTLNSKLICFENDYKSIFQTFGINGNFCNYMIIVEEVEAKEEKRRKDVDIFGPTSSSKSLIVNHLMRMDVMRNSVGHTTPCAVVINATDEKKAYYCDGNSPERVLINLSTAEGRHKFYEVVDRHRKNHSKTSIKLFLPKDEVKGTILTSYMVLLDSPVMELDVFQLNEVKEFGVIVLVIDIVTGLNRKKTWEALNKCQIFVRSNVLVVFNKCDKFEYVSPQRRHNLIERALKAATEFLTRDNGPYRTEEEARKAVFFISTSEVRQEQRRSQQISSFTESPGYFTEATGLYNTTREWRLAGFKSFERSLVSLAVGQREQMEEQRIRRAVHYTKELINKAREVGSQLNDVIKMLNTLLARYGFYSKGRYDDFVERFYNRTIEEGEENIKGRITVKLFLKYIMDEGREEIRRAVLSNNTAVDERLLKYVEKSLKEAIQEVCSESEESILHDFASKLDPVVDESSRLNEDIKRIEAQKAEVGSQLDKKLKRNKEELKDNLKKFKKIQKINKDKKLKKLHDLKEKRENEFGAKGVARAILKGLVIMDNDGRVRIDLLLAAIGMRSGGAVPAEEACSPTVASFIAGRISSLPVLVTLSMVTLMTKGAALNALELQNRERKLDEEIVEADAEYERHDDHSMYVDVKKQRKESKIRGDKKAKGVAADKVSNYDNKIAGLRMELENERAKALENRRNWHKKVLKMIMAESVGHVSDVLSKTFERDSNQLQIIHEKLLSIIPKS